MDKPQTGDNVCETASRIPYHKNLLTIGKLDSFRENGLFLPTPPPDSMLEKTQASIDAMTKF